MASSVDDKPGTRPATASVRHDMSEVGSAALGSWAALDAQAREHGDAFFAIDPAVLDANLGAMREAFARFDPRVAFAYSYKTNPTPAVCRWALSQGMRAEVASALELWLARRVGVPDSDIVLTGVGRDANVVGDALSAGSLVVLDGDRDVDSALGWADRADRGHRSGRVLLRLRVPTAVAPEPRLGMTVEAAVDAHRRLASEPGIEVAGLHMHSVDRSLAGLVSRLDIVGEVGARLFEHGPATLDLGNPLPSAAPDEAVDTWGAYARTVAAFVDALGWTDTQLVLEPGTPLVAHAASLVARVLDVRTQPGRTVATIGASILHSSPNTRRVDFPARLVTPPGCSRPQASVPLFVAGSTLIDGDWLVLDLPGTAHPGDFVVIDNVGAYSIGMDSSFIDPPLPVIMRHGDAWVTVRRAPSFDEAMPGFAW